MSNPSLKLKKSVPPGTGVSSAVEYAGKRTKTGNSMGFRFEGALFKSHPEFSGGVRARVIAPGRLLVVAEAMEEEDSDPVIGSFLAFLQADMVGHPAKIMALDAGLTGEIAALTIGVVVNPEEDLGNEDLL